MAGFFKGVRKFLGQTGQVLKRVGETGVGLLKKYHQPLSMGLAGVADATGNPTLKTLAGYGLLASAGATGLGWGTDYGSHSKPYKPMYQPS